MLGRGIEFIRFLAILVLAPSKKAVGDIFFFLRQATAFKKKNSPPPCLNWARRGGKLREVLHPSLMDQTRVFFKQIQFTECDCSFSFVSVRAPTSEGVNIATRHSLRLVRNYSSLLTC